MKNWKLVILLILLSLFYAFYIHEFLHYLIAKLLGYNAIIDFSFLAPHNFINPPVVDKIPAFLIAMAPYILDFLFMSILFLIFLYKKDQKVFYFSFIPLLNTVGNSPFITGFTDDFNKLISFGFSALFVYTLSLITIIFFVIFLFVVIRNKSSLSSTNNQYRQYPIPKPLNNQKM